MKKGNIQLELVTESDYELLMAWRSHPLVYQYFYKQEKPLVWEEHLNFWTNRSNREDWIISYHENDRLRKVGSINVSKLDTNTPEVGIFIGEVTLWGKHIATDALLLILDWLKEKTFNTACACIDTDNERSQKLFEKAGFTQKKLIHNDKQWHYEITLNK